MDFCYLLSGDRRIDMPDETIDFLAGQQVPAVPRKTAEGKIAVEEIDSRHAFAGVFAPASQCNVPFAALVDVLECSNQFVDRAQRARQFAFIGGLLGGGWDPLSGGRQSRWLALRCGNQTPH